MQPTGKIWPLGNRLAKGHLAEILVAQREGGASYNQIARLLEAKFRIEVTGETVRRWFSEMTVEATA